MIVKKFLMIFLLDDIIYPDVASALQLSQPLDGQRVCMWLG